MTKPLYQLMKHQEAGIRACNGREYYAYFMDPGLGKTLCIIDECQRLPVETIVVICPKSIISVWAKEIEKFAPSNGIGVWKGDCRPGKGKYWTVINIDAVNRTKTSTGEGFAMVKQLLTGFKNTMLVIDESTIIKNSDSKRTKAVMELGLLAKYRRILTGTPVANTPMDIYAQMRFLSKDIFPYSKNFYAFRAKYAVMGGFQLRQIVGYKCQEQLAMIMAQHSFRASKAECLDLPPRTTQIRDVELSPATWRAYRALVDELAIEFAGTQMSIDMAITKISKLRQLTGGWMKDDTGKAHPVGHEKLTELKHLLDECVGQKVIIWAEFTSEILALQSIHPLAKVYHGGMNSKARDEAIEAFERGQCPIIVIQNATGSMGLTLNAATVSIFYSNPIYPLHKQQARERNHRIGQIKSVTEYELIVKGSIDQTIYNSIINKKSLADALLEARSNPAALRDALIPKLPKINWKAPSKGH